MEPKITFFMADGTSISGGVPFRVPLITSKPTRVEIEHPMCHKLTFFGPNFIIWNEAVIHPQRGKIVMTNVGVIKDNFAVGYTISKNFIHKAVLDISKFSQKSLEKMIK